ncbi:MAG: SRPBCC family protein [Leptothrix sp. (in: b-proteobacteria)]
MKPLDIMAPAAPAARQFRLVSVWRIAAPLEAVWAALVETETWSRWWPNVRSVELLRDGGADGLGSVRRIVWTTLLPYTLQFEVEVVESIRHQQLRGRARGQLDGEGLWQLRARGGHTEVTYTWSVDVHKAWMRLLAPLLAPLFRWNHHGVMRQGGRGLAAHLQARLLEVRSERAA